jgi:hypothetical protein
LQAPTKIISISAPDKVFAGWVFSVRVYDYGIPINELLSAALGESGTIFSVLLNSR